MPVDDRSDIGGFLQGVIARTDAEPRRLTYEEAEADVLRLAAELVAAYGHREVRQFRYAAIPRGGIIVLGMLSYVLDLKADSLSRRRPEEPLVAIDDCSLTGRRFSQFLQADTSPEVIFAHLYSPAELRKAIEAQEPRVIACLAARDLRDLARESYPDDDAYRAWQARWHERFEKTPRYWVGQPELVIFPWSEPDLSIWNPVTNQTQDDWRLAPPDRCLKNWARLGVPPRLDARRIFRSPDGVVYGLRDGQVTLCRLQTDRVYSLNGIATEMWRALAAYGDPAVVVEHLRSLYEIDEATLRHDVDEFAESLLAAGLLERTDE